MTSATGESTAAIPQQSTAIKIGKKHGEHTSCHGSEQNASVYKKRWAFAHATGSAWRHGTYNGRVAVTVDYRRAKDRGRDVFRKNKNEVKGHRRRRNKD